MKKGMSAKDVIDLYKKLEDLDVKIWIDGGWAVDALVGTQTRPHEDLDIAVERVHLTKLREYLESQGYREVSIHDDKKWDLVLNNKNGYQVEIHAFDLDTNMSVVTQEDWDGYSGNSLTGTGLIDGHTVRCVSLEQILKTHDASKRKFKSSDHQDLAVLAKKFDIDLLY